MKAELPIVDPFIAEDEFITGFGEPEDCGDYMRVPLLVERRATPGKPEREQVIKRYLAIPVGRFEHAIAVLCRSAASKDCPARETTKRVN